MPYRVPSTMTGFLASVTDYHNYIMSLRDPRTVDWGITANPCFIIPVTLAYLYVVKIWGPRWMMNRKPYNLKSVIMVYNLLQVIANVFFFVQYVRHSYVGGGYSLFCQGVSYSTDENTMVLLTLSWWYMFVRIADFLDSFFFIAAKKFSHLTFLHVIHHFLVVLNGCWWIVFGSDGQIIMTLCVNAAVHVIMYGYYFLAALGPAVQKHLWWKKYLTGLQILQIVYLSLHMCVPLVHDCGYPKILIFIAIPQAMMGLGLFIRFYANSYACKSRPELCISQTKQH